MALNGSYATFKPVRAYNFLNELNALEGMHNFYIESSHFNGPTKDSTGPLKAAPLRSASYGSQ